MKIKCYCIGCSKHPLYEKRKEFKDWVTGCNAFIYLPEHIAQGADVTCFDPQSGFFEDFDIDNHEISFDDLWYGDGSSFTKSEQTGYTVYSTCGNEDYEGEDA